MFVIDMVRARVCVFCTCVRGLFKCVNACTRVVVLCALHRIGYRGALLARTVYVAIKMLMMMMMMMPGMRASVRAYVRACVRATAVACTDGVQAAWRAPSGVYIM